MNFAVNENNKYSLIAWLRLLHARLLRREHQGGRTLTTKTACCRSSRLMTEAEGTITTSR